ncbi:hypothetical protein TrRE_jg7071, partial [Triparma retinervis]
MQKQTRTRQYVPKNEGSECCRQVNSKEVEVKDRKNSAQRDYCGGTVKAHGVRDDNIGCVMKHCRVKRSPGLGGLVSSLVIGLGFLASTVAGILALISLTHRRFTSCWRSRNKSRTPPELILPRVFVKATSPTRRMGISRLSSFRLLAIALFVLPTATATFTPADNAELKTAVQAHLTDKTAADTTYGDISGWDMRLVTNMDKIFCGSAYYCYCGDLLTSTYRMLYHACLMPVAHLPSGMTAGSTDLQDCLTCGTNCPSEGGECLNGFRRSVSWSCDTCPAGAHISADGSACVACVSGKYSGSGASSCTTCSDGEYSPAGASICTSCEAGKYTGDLAACYDCPAGSYTTTGGRTSCDICAAGRYTTVETTGTAEDNCTNCPSGRYLADDAATPSLHVGLSLCLNCDAGKYANDPTTASSCIICSSGKYATLASTSCTDCEAGKYNEIPSQPSCVACGAGRFSTAVASIIESDCENCARGKASLDEIRSTECVDCPQGTSAPAPGLKVCVDCSAGTYSNSTGGMSCTKCTVGQYSKTVASTSCQECGSGTFNLNEGSVGCDKCAG